MQLKAEYQELTGEAPPTASGGGKKKDKKGGGAKKQESSAAKPASSPVDTKKGIHMYTVSFLLLVICR